MNPANSAMQDLSAFLDIYSSMKNIFHTMIIFYATMLADYGKGIKNYHTTLADYACGIILQRRIKRLSPSLLVFLLNKKIAIYAPVYFGNADYHNSVKAQEKFPMRFQFFAGVKLFFII